MRLLNDCNKSSYLHNGSMNQCYSIIVSHLFTVGENGVNRLHRLTASVSAQTITTNLTPSSTLSTLPDLIQEFFEVALEVGEGDGALGEEAAQGVEFRVREQGLHGGQGVDFAILPRLGHVVG